MNNNQQSQPVPQQQHPVSGEQETQENADNEELVFIKPNLN